MNVLGNELADKEAKKGARQAKYSDMEENVRRDKKQITKALKKTNIRQMEQKVPASRK